MSWQESGTRLRQEVSKRSDLIQYRTGRRFRGPASRATSRRPQFFFSADEAGRRALLLRTYLPASASQIVTEADEICQHRFSLLGYEGLDYGPQIDWHLDAVHGKRAPFRPWYRIDFLSFDEVGDHKVIWELNRHQHLVTLAKAWRLSGDQRYLTELYVQWYAWQEANPYPMGINWASSLEVAFRSLSWLWVRELIAGANAGASSFLSDLVRRLGLNARYIERYLSTFFSPNTHLLGEALALFFIGTLCPELPGSDRWRDQGWQILGEEITRQVRPGGVYFEQTLYYHVYALDFFLHARLLAARNEIPVPEEFDRTVEKMLAVVEGLSQAGRAAMFGDDDGGRLFDARRNRVEHMTDPLALGALLYQQPSIARAATLTEEAIWLFGDRAIERLCRERGSRFVRSTSFDGIYVLASEEPCPQQMMVDAGPQGTGRSGHGHADALSIRFSMNGQDYLVDAGTACYISDNEDRAWFRGTAAHNTLAVDSVDQAITAGPFAWTSIPQVTTERWVSGRGFDLFRGTHDGYGRLPKGLRHERWLLRLAGGLWVIRDVAHGEGRHFIESFWHFAPDITMQASNGVVIASAGDASANRLSLALVPVADSPWQLEIGSAPYSPAYGIKQAAPMLRISADCQTPAECVLALVVHRETEEISLLRDISESAQVRAYHYQGRGSSHYFYFCGNGTNWAHGAWTSDAEFLYCRFENGSLVHLVLTGATRLGWQANFVLASEHRTERLEYLRGQDTPDLSPVDKAALDRLREDKLEYLDLAR